MNDHTPLMCPQRERIGILETTVRENRTTVRENSKMLHEIHAKVTNGMESKIAALWKLVWGVLIAAVVMPWVQGIVEGLVK